MGNTANDWILEGRKALRPGFRDRRKSSTSAPRYYTQWTDGSNIPDYTYQFSAGSFARILDENHPFWYEFQRQRRKNRRFRSIDVGGPLVIEKYSISDPGGVKGDKQVGRTTWTHFDGIYAPSAAYRNALQQVRLGNFPSIPAEIGMSNSALRALGATGIAKSLPDVPPFSLARFIGELREGLPKIPLRELAKSERKISSLGGEYLNVQFGLLPTISDVSKLIHLAGHPELRRRVRHTLGQETRVRKTLVKESTTSSRNLTLSEMSTLPSTFVSGQRGTEVTSNTTKIWISSSFVYYQAYHLNRLLDDLDEQLGNFGSIPRLIDYWNLTAWSWFIDWFTNFNHVVTNLSYLGRDGLTLQRSYLMATHTKKIQTFQSCIFNGSPARSVGEIEYSRKYRTVASPFGFGFTWDTFDPFQTSILVALGISKLRF
jgi:hypothetical protein